MHDSSARDTDTATNSDAETFILIGPCSDLYSTVRVNGWACLSFASLLVPFPAILSCWWKSTCDAAMPWISKTTKDKAEQLIALVRENVAVYDRSSDDYSTSSSFRQTPNNGFEWTVPWMMQVKGEGNAQPSVSINTTKNVRNSVCCYVPIACTHKGFARRRNACCMLIRIRARFRTNGLAD